jgi:multiple sugar transport system permease protein
MSNKIKNHIDIFKDHVNPKMLLGKSSAIAIKFLRFYLLLGVCFVLLYPLLYMLSNAFRPFSELSDPGVIWIPKQFTMDNFRIAFDALSYRVSALNTARISIVSALLQLISCSLIGYGLARYRFAERGLIFALALFTIIVPPQTIILSTFLNFRFFDYLGLEPILRLVFPNLKESILDTAWTFYLPAITGTGIRSGLFIFIFRQFFKGLPKELEYSAKIDGCGAYSTYFRVMLPNSGAVIITVFLFSVVWYWNDYYAPALLLSNNFPLSVALSRIRSALQLMNVAEENVSADQVRVYLQAASLLYILPMLVLYIFTQRYFTESIERTGLVE